MKYPDFICIVKSSNDVVYILNQKFQCRGFFGGWCNIYQKYKYLLSLKFKYYI